MHATRSKGRASQPPKASGKEIDVRENGKRRVRGRKLGLVTPSDDKPVARPREETDDEDDNHDENNRSEDEDINGSDEGNEEDEGIEVEDDNDDDNEEDEEDDDEDDGEDEEEGSIEGHEEDEEEDGEEEEDKGNDAEDASEDEDALLKAALSSVKAVLKNKRPASGEEDSSESDSEEEASLPSQRNRPLAVEEVAWRPSEGIQGVAQGDGASDQRERRNKRSKGDAGGAPSLLASAAIHKTTVMPSLDLRKLARQQRKLAPKTAGPKFFDMPAPTLTPELKQELRLLKLRGAMDPKRFYKAADSKKFPTFFQIGTVVEGPTEYYSARLTKKERKRTFTEELLAQSEAKAYMKKKFLQIQKAKQAGGKGDYKERMKKRKPWAVVK